MLISIDFNWEDLGSVSLDSKDKLQFSSLSTEPGVYRFLVDDSAGQRQAYVGETRDLSHRMRKQYRNMQGHTVRWVRAWLTDALRVRASVRLERATGIEVRANGNNNILDLIRKNDRELLQSAGIIEARMAGWRVMNRPGIGEEPGHEAV